jgi:hypothetical protein
MEGFYPTADLSASRKRDFKALATSKAAAAAIKGKY